VHRVRAELLKMSRDDTSHVLCRGALQLQVRLSSSTLAITVIIHRLLAKAYGVGAAKHGKLRSVHCTLMDHFLFYHKKRTLQRATLYRRFLPPLTT
jgi:hypothetical protein